MDLDGFLDVAAEKARLQKDRVAIESQLKTKQQKLSNQSFVDRAPPDVVQRERDAIHQLNEQLASVIQALEGLKS